MPTFAYTAANNRGEILSGELETADVKAVIDYLNRQELMIISVKPKKEFGGSLNADIFFGLDAPDKIMLVKHLSTIIKSGLSLKEGVEIILNDTSVKPLKKILTDAKFNLEKGLPLSVTFKKYPKIFSPVFVAFIEAGEASGTLDKSLEYLGSQLAKEYEMNQKVRGAMVYPAVLMMASAAVIVVLMVFVVPKLVKVFSQSSLNLPWTTKFVISVSNALTANLYLMTAVLIAVVYVFLRFRSSVVFRKGISEAILAVPLVSELYRKIIFARFTRVLGTLLASGVGIIRALDISAEAIGPGRYQEVIKNLKPEISKGVSLGNALRRQKESFPHLVASMINVGEKTGKLDSILIDLAGFYEEEVNNKLKDLVSLVEPLLLLIMGLVVATIAFAIITPIYQLIGAVR